MSQVRSPPPFIYRFTVHGPAPYPARLMCTRIDTHPPAQGSQRARSGRGRFTISRLCVS